MAAPSLHFPYRVYHCRRKYRFLFFAKKLSWKHSPLYGVRRSCPSQVCDPCPPHQELPFSQVWCSNQQPLHCAFTLERCGAVAAAAATATQLSCKISVRQVKGQEQMLQVYTAVAEVSVSLERRLSTAAQVFSCSLC